MEDRIDRRSTDEIRFSDNQFNLAFEFVQYAPSKEKKRSGQFLSKVIPENVAVLEAHVVKETDGEAERTEIPLVDCKILYPDMITGETLIGEDDSIMYCLTPDQTLIQGQQYFDTFQSI